MAPDAVMDGSLVAKHTHTPIHSHTWRRWGERRRGDGGVGVDKEQGEVQPDKEQSIKGVMDREIERDHMGCFMWECIVCGLGFHDYRFLQPSEHFSSISPLVIVY